MHLINTLAAGMRGGESGSAAITKRGTSARAQWFKEYEGITAVSDGKDIPLDQYGRALVFVDEPVTVTVKKSDGASLASYVDGDSSNNVEYIGDSFTGTPYDGGPAAVSQPIVLDPLLGRWLDNNGAIDWKVLFEGSSQTIPAALGALTNFVFNVKDLVYGAVGDAVADDTSAIQSAITAANAAGGVAFFPPGTYKLTSALTVGSRASLLGSAPNSTELRMAADATVLSFTGTTVYQRQWASGFRINHTVSAASTAITVASSAKLGLNGIYLVGTNLTGFGITDDASACDVVITDSYIATNGGSTGLLYDSNGLSKWALRDSTFAWLNASNVDDALIQAQLITAESCKFDCGDRTGASGFSLILPSVTGTPIHMAILSSEFVGANASFTGNSNAMVAGVPPSAGDSFTEKGNRFTGGKAFTSLAAYVPILASTEVLSTFDSARDGRYFFFTDNTTPVLLSAHTSGPYETVVLKRTDTTAQTLTNSLYPGYVNRLVVKNKSGTGPVTITLGSGFQGATSPVVLADNDALILETVGVEDGSGVVKGLLIAENTVTL